jgi:iron complex transport system ATP-binding protein
MLVAEALGFGYRGRSIGRNVGFRLARGQVLCLLAPNGGGKSTLIKTLLGLLPPIEGRVLLDGRELGFWTRREIAQRLGYVPQHHEAHFPFEVADMVLMGRAARLPGFAAPSARDREVAGRALETLGIGALHAAAYTEISGGERQLVLIARALAQEPEALLLDEPAANLDYGNRARVLAHVRHLADSGIAVLMSTHEPEHARSCADWILMLKDGAVFAAGPPQALLTRERLDGLYGLAPPGLAPDAAADPGLPWDSVAWRRCTGVSDTAPR